MNLRNVLRTYSLLRQLSDDESALLATLRGMSDSERESLVLAMQPEKAGGKKKLGEVLTRKIEKCEACNYTRRAVVHKDPNADGYHEFQPPKSSAKGEKKSARAADMQATLSKNLAQQRQTDNAKCTYTSDGKICLGAEDDAIHDPAMGYGGYHLFVPPASNAAQKSSRSSVTVGLEASSEIAKAAATSAGGNDGSTDIS